MVFWSSHPFPSADPRLSNLVDNTFSLILPDESGSPLRQILDLVRTSDSIATKSEGTRVLVNAVKSLWGTDPKSHGSSSEKTP